MLNSDFCNEFNTWWINKTQVKFDLRKLVKTSGHDTTEIVKNYSEPLKCEMAKPINSRSNTTVPQLSIDYDFE